MIQPNKEYSLKEIISLQLIPGVVTYVQAYNLAARLSTDGKNERIINTVTSIRTLKSRHQGNPWNKISGKILIEGKEIIKFLQINKLKKSK